MASMSSVGSGTPVWHFPGDICTVWIYPPLRWGDGVGSLATAINAGRSAIEAYIAHRIRSKAEKLTLLLKNWVLELKDMPRGSAARESDVTVANLGE